MFAGGSLLIGDCLYYGKWLPLGIGILFVNESSDHESGQVADHI